MHIKKNLATAMTALFLFGVGLPYLPAGAVGVAELEKRGWETKQKEARQKNILDEKQRKVNSFFEQLKIIQLNLEDAEKDHDDAVNRLETIEGQIENNKVALGVLQENLVTKTKVLNKRMRDIYKNGQVNYLDVLLGAIDFFDFANRMHLLKRVLTQDVNLVNQIKIEQVALAQIKSELEQDRILVLQVKEEAETKRELIEQRKNEVEKMLIAAVEERDVAEKAYEELMATSREIENMLRKAKTPSGAAKGTGAMIWPVSSTYITSSFGWRTHPIFGTSRFHSGLDIAADYGEVVAAADSGTVVSSGWIGGYGKTVIIDHGGGISTLYAHNSSLVVGEGQRVSKGQLIAYVGATGYATGPHLHFEVRVNGSPVNPMSYF